MTTNKTTPKELWARQQISGPDVDYDLWNKKRISVQAFSQMSQSCIFTVDVFKERYDFASDSFAHLFGYNPTWIKTIKQQGDLLEERIHPDDRIQLTECQIEHGQFIYSLPPEERNDYRQIFQFRMLNARQQYINVSSRQQVIETDRNGKAWIIMGVMDILPDQTPIERIKRTVVNRKTGEMLPTCTVSPDKQLSNREKEILRLIRQGFLSKEIAYQLGVSIYEQSPEKHPKQVRCQQYNGSHPYSRKSWYLPLRLRKPTETVRQLICFAPLFKLLISADTSRKDSMINLYTWNRYTIRHIEFDLQYRFPNLRSKALRNSGSHLFYNTIIPGTFPDVNHIKLPSILFSILI